MGDSEMKKFNKWTSLLALIMVMVMAFAAIPVSSYAEGEKTYGTLKDDSDKYDLDFDTDLVKQIQRALNKYFKAHGKSTISVDGDYGPGTANAVKLFQYMYGLTVDGVCGPKTLKALGIDTTGIKHYPRWMPDLEEAFNSKSTNGFALHLNLGSNRLEAYRLIDGEWKLIRVMACATGNTEKGYFTDLACKKSDGTNHRYIKGDGDSWRGYNAVLIGKGDYFHSVLAHKKRGEWVFDDNSCLGKYVTHGCVRLSQENAKWVRENATKGTAIVIDDRAWKKDITN